MTEPLPDVEDFVRPPEPGREIVGSIAGHLGDLEVIAVWAHGMISARHSIEVDAVRDSDGKTTGIIEGIAW